MTCAELEILLCDYVDGTLASDQRIVLEQHVAGCEACAQLARDVAGITEFLETVPAVEPPRELVARILGQIPAERTWWQRLWSGTVEGVLQPRFVMGMAMTILSVSMLAKLAGFDTKELSHAELDPAKVWQTLDDRGYRIWDRTVKYCDNMPLVSDLQSQWNEWSAESQAEEAGSGR